MFTAQELEELFIGLCLEGFFYGLYFAIFVIYLKCASERTGTPAILFYALCLLYVLTTASFVSDLVNLIFQSRIGKLSLQLQNDAKPMLFRLGIVQITVSSGSDFIAQSIMIYRCYITWGQDIRFVIIPSFLAVVYFATYLATAGSASILQVHPYNGTWGFPMVLTSFAASMTVNTLVTGLIVFRILKVYLEVKPTSIERTLGSTGSTKFQHVIFIVIESGMALLATQLVRVVLVVLPVELTQPAIIGLNLVIGINTMFNGITPTIILVRTTMKLSFDDKESFVEAVESLRFNSPASDSTNTLQRTDSISSSDLGLGVRE